MIHLYKTTSKHTSFWGTSKTNSPAKECGAWLRRNYPRRTPHKAPAFEVSTPYNTIPLDPELYSRTWWLKDKDFPRGHVRQHWVTVKNGFYLLTYQ